MNAGQDPRPPALPRRRPWTAILLAHFLTAAALPSEPPPAPPATPPVWSIEGDGEWPGFATIVAPAGDINADGCDDILVGQLGAGLRPGRVLAYYGSTNGLGRTPSWEGLAPPDRREHAFGSFAAGVGDLNGDGYDDIIAKGDANRALPGPFVDELYVFPGSATGLAKAPDWRWASPYIVTGEIHTAGRAGDVNADGCADFYAVTTVPGTGSYLLVFHGSRQAEIIVAAGRWRFPESRPDARIVAAAAGDLDRDGFDDLIVGDLLWGDDSGRPGRVLAYRGSATGLTREPFWTANVPWDHVRLAQEPHALSFGHSIATGDPDGDGFRDVLVGAPHAERDDYYEGLAFLFRGSAAGLATRPAWTVDGNSVKSVLGWSVDGGGDLNGDGFDDLVVGAPGFSGAVSYSSAAFVFHGSARGPSTQPSWSFGGGAGKRTVGSNVAFAGDVNGDGLSDLLIGDQDFQRQHRTVGRVLVFYGSASGLAGSAGLSLRKPLLAQIEQLHDRTPIAAKLVVAFALLAVALGFFIAWRRALARLRASERQAARTEERARLARDVHDHLGASLSQIALWSNLTGNAATPPDQLQAHLDRITRTAREALDDIHNLVWALDPAHDTVEDFAGHLTSFAERFLEAAGIPLSASLPISLPATPLPAEVRSQLARIAREVLRNIVQHARATQVTLELTFTATHLQLVIADNGIGFHPSAPPPRPDGRPGGHGLSNLRTRAESIAGHLDIDSTPGRGTTVRVEVPLAGRAAPPQGEK